MRVWAQRLQPSSAGQFKPRNDVKLSEPDIDWSYAVIERQSKENLTTSLLPFNLGKVVLEEILRRILSLCLVMWSRSFQKQIFAYRRRSRHDLCGLEGEFVSSGSL